MGTEEVYIGTADRYEIAAVGLDGSTRYFGKDTPPVPLTRDLVRTWQDSLVQRVSPANRAAVRRQLSRAVLPDHLPAYSDMRVDPNGAVWVARFGAPGETITVWDVFQEEGRLAASLEIPLSFRPMEIGADYVLGVSTDELGVERVVQYMLIR